MEKACEMMRINAYPTVLLALMGSMDCVTTVIGIIYFGAVELNPFFSAIVKTNLSVFVVLKLATTFFVCIILIEAEKILMKTQNKTTKAFAFTRNLLKFSKIGIIAFLAIVVANNVMVLVNAA
jgi:hypothetical protein